MLADDVMGLLCHAEDSTVSDNELLNKELFGFPATNDTLTDILFSSECTFGADNIQTRDTMRRNTYRQRQKAYKEDLYVQVEELSKQLSTLIKAKEMARESLKMTPGAIWKALATRNQIARQRAEEQRVKLYEAVKERATLIQDLGQLIRKRINEETHKDTGYLTKRLRLETPDRALYEAYLKELDEIYAMTDSVFLGTVGLADVDFCDSTRSFHQSPRSFCSGATYDEFVGAFTTPFSYDKVRDHLHEVNYLKFRSGLEVIDDPSLFQNATITKCRSKKFMGSALEHCVMRRYNDRDRIVFVWRKFLEGEGLFAGMHLDETGWCIVRPLGEDGSSSSVLELVTRFVPMNFSMAAASGDLVQQFADLMIKDCEAIWKLGLQTLEDRLLDDALNLY